MALAPLASVPDLPESWQLSTRAAKALGIASSAVRDAADSAISEVIGTITITAPAGSVLGLPALARDVTAVTIDGTTVTDYRNLGTALWRAVGWASEPVPVTVTGTFGLPAVPDDIVDLTVQLAVAWLQHDEQGGGSTAGLLAVGLDDASERYSDEAAGQVSPVFIPEATREWLRSRFSGGVVVVETL